jgi:hypothetical protein
VDKPARWTRFRDGTLGKISGFSIEHRAAIFRRHRIRNVLD